MPRAGGGAGGGHSSGGGHSGGYTSGGHNMGSSRPGSYGAGGGCRAGYGGGPVPGGYGRGPARGPGYYRRPPRRPPGRWGRPVAYISGGLIILVIVLVLFAGSFASCGSSYGSSSSVPASTQNREALESDGYINDNIVDEIGWINNRSSLSKDLQYFYDKTGVEPFIYLKSYDSSLTTDNEKLEWAEAYYDENIDNEYTFLYVYFAEENTDYEVGYMAYVNGHQVSAVMDSEAVEIFWAYMDEYWYSNLDTDAMFSTVFEKTADRIMTRTRTTRDIVYVILIIVAVVAVTAGIVYVMKLRRKHEAERNAETERILNTPLGGGADDDDLVNKYKK